MLRFLRKMQISSQNCGVQYAASMSSAFLMTFWALYISMHFGTLLKLIYPLIPRQNRHRVPNSFLMTLLSTILTRKLHTFCLKFWRTGVCLQSASNRIEIWRTQNVIKSVLNISEAHLTSQFCLGSCILLAKWALNSGAQGSNTTQKVHQNAS